MRCMPCQRVMQDRACSRFIAAHSAHPIITRLVSSQSTHNRLCMLQAMFLGSLPISHAVIPNFPVAGDPSEALTSQQRAAAYQAQLEWHAPSLVKHGPEADFTTNWDGDRHDPTRYPIAAGLYMGPLPPEEADTRQVCCIREAELLRGMCAAAFMMRACMFSAGLH